MANPTGLKIGIVHPQLYPQTMSGEGPVVETVAALAAETSLSTIELAHVRDELTRARLKVLLASSGMRVAFSAAPSILRHGWDLGAEDAAARADALAGVKAELEEAHYLGARLFGVMSGPDCAADQRAAARGRLAESLTRLGEEAGRMGIAVSLEPCDRDIDQKRLIGPVAEAVEVVKGVKRDNVGLTLDLAHLLLLKENVADAVSAARSFTLHAQVSNCVLAEGHPARGDQHPVFGTEGGLAGADTIAAFLKALDKYGFWKRPNGGWLTIEVRPREEEYSSVVLAGALRAVYEAAATL